MSVSCFGNVGNSCYVAACLNLLSVSGLVDDCKKEAPQSKLVQTLVEAMKSCDLRVAMVALSEVVPSGFVVNQQNDASELLLLLVENLQRCAPESVKAVTGTMTHVVICSQCRNISATEENFVTLPLPITNSSISSCFSDLTKTEIVNNFQCNTCDKPTVALKKMTLKDVPRLFIIQLIKYNDTPLKLPEKLTFEENTNYNLIATIDHYGDNNNGHYTTSIKNNDNWTLINDHQTKTITTPTNENNYCILYKRK